MNPLTLASIALALTAQTPAQTPAPSPEPSLLDSITAGDAVPVAQREATLPAGTVEGGFHIGLVGGGDTRVQNEIRWAPLGWLELRTAFVPLPTVLMARARLNSAQSGGALLVDGGLAGVDLALNTAPELGVGWAAYAEGGLAYVVAPGGDVTASIAARYRHRFSFEGDPQHALALAAKATYDALPGIAVSGGVGYVNTLDTEAVERVLVFAESGQPGITWLLAKGETSSFSVPLAVTFSRTETFDFDVFVTAKVYPEWDAMAGAGLRMRL